MFDTERLMKKYEGKPPPHYHGWIKFKESIIPDYPSHFTQIRKDLDEFYRKVKSSLGKDYDDFTTEIFVLEILSCFQNGLEVQKPYLDVENWRRFYSGSQLSKIIIPYKVITGSAVDLPIKLYRFIQGELSDAEWFFSNFSYDIIIASELFKMISSSNTPEMLQESLFDFLGIDKIELICELILKRQNIIEQIYELYSRRRSYLQFSGSPQKSVPVNAFNFSNNLLKSEQKKLKRFNKKNYENFDKKHKNFNWNFVDKFFKEANIQPKSKRRGNNLVSIPYESRTYPNVYDSSICQTLPIVVGSTKLHLPSTAKRINTPTYEEIVIFADPPKLGEFISRKIDVSRLSSLEQRVFGEITSLNVIQSLIYETAMNSSENLLICAPTGAGKTNIALLTILRDLKRVEKGELSINDFRVVYVAPMKALASEITHKFTDSLRFLNLKIREVTGDTQMATKEISSSHIIITTPEKWDILTRRCNDETAYTLKTRLLIIDEIHLLQDNRGAVLESLVARSHKMTQTHQLSLRIIGLSATLPNYLDVATFLKVDPNTGLFFFDSGFRSVPLEQTFIGIKPSTNSYETQRIMDSVCFEKIKRFIREEHQVIIFVHSRGFTRKTALAFKEHLQNSSDYSLLSKNRMDHGQRHRYQFQNKQLEDLAECGISLHHAGLSKHDRSIVERLFTKGVIRVLVSTSTLAWGVNLPAHTVIIKGTSFYDTNNGGFRNIGILDILQMFGRAGRPQYDNQGCGILISEHALLAGYIGAMVNNFPIESRFSEDLPDALNAEIVLGTVSNIKEAVEWLSNTFMYIRMIKNPLVYGLTQNDIDIDPALCKYRRELIMCTAKVLEMSKMIRFNSNTECFDTTALGRIGSHYYISHKSINLFMSNLKESMTDLEIFHLIAASAEFEQLKLREDEKPELLELNSKCPHRCDRRDLDSTKKVIILLQAYISGLSVDSFSLGSELFYISQNIGRLMKGYYEICVYQGFPCLIHKFLNLIKAFEQKIWPHHHPLTQLCCSFDINRSVAHKLANLRISLDQLEEMSSYEIGSLVHHISAGSILSRMVKSFPKFELTASAQPITRSVLQITLTFVPKFDWNNSVMTVGSDQWVYWIEDPDTHYITHYDQVKLSQKKLKMNKIIQEVFSIPLFEPLPSQYIVRLVSLKFLGAETEAFINPCDCHLPDICSAFTDLLPLQPLPISVLGNNLFSKLYKFKYMNPIQTQVFHTIYWSEKNILLGAPTGSGKTLVAELAMLRAFKDKKAKIVYISPLKALIKERKEDWGHRFGTLLKKNIVELTGDVSPDMKSMHDSDVILTTPEKWDGISRKWRDRTYVPLVKLLILDEVHLLGSDRGHILEAIVSRVKMINTETGSNIRIVALSTATSNSLDLANWLNVPPEGLFNFCPSVRSVPLEVHIHGFPSKHYCPRMESMNKTVYLSIKNYSPNKPVLIFTSSRRQTRLTAQAMLNFSTMNDVPDKWCQIPSHDLTRILSSVTDSSLKSFIEFGIGIHHAGLVEQDRRTTEYLFLNNMIQIMISTSTLAWGVNFPAHLVIIKGTEYHDVKTHTYIDYPITDILQMMGRAGRPQFDTNGVAVILVHHIKKNYYKRFLFNPFPVESSLIESLPNHLNAEISSRALETLDDAQNYLKLSYLYRRLMNNPSYYGLKFSAPTELQNYLNDLIISSISTLESAGCAVLEDDLLKTTPIGNIGSFYYLSYKTMQMFNNYLNSECSIRDILVILSNATEFENVPVRHNEDVYNEDLAKMLPLRHDSDDFSSPFIKTFLLLQAHIGRIELPIKDYITDKKSIIDQALRILQAMVEVCSHKAHLRAAIQCTILLQCIVQACWWHKSSLFSIPGVEYGNYDTVCEVFGRNLHTTVDSIAQLTLLNHETINNLNRDLWATLGSENVRTIINCIESLPRISVTWLLFSENKLIYRSNEYLQVNHGYNINYIKLDRNAKLKLVFNLKYESLKPESSKKTSFSRLGKDIDESWILFIGEKDKDRLVGLKRIHPVRYKSKTSLFIGPFREEDFGSRIILSLYLIGESLFGLDQQFDIPLELVSNSQKIGT